MSTDFLRYSCQMALPGFTEDRQKLLQNARVLLVGAGGLGCPASLYLAAAGIGTLGLADADTISVSNLHRQILFTAEETGKPKAVVAGRKLQLQNPSILVNAYEVRVTASNVMNLVSGYDIVVDCTDNFETRYLLNDACVLAGKPLVYGGIYQYEGQVAVWNVTNDDGTRSPHYRDVFPSVDAAQVPDCAEGGVLPTLAGIIGSIQANEVIKWVTGIGEVLAGKMFILNVTTLESHIIKIGKRTRTPVGSLPQQAEVPEISIDELKEMMKQGSCALLDVRNNDERVAFHIGGKHIPLHELVMQEETLDDHQPLVVYCASGKRSAEAVKWIKERSSGARVFSLKGGMKAWVEKL